MTEPRRDPVLDRDDGLENALEQDGCEQREGEGLAEHLGEVLHEQVQDDHIDKDINHRRRGVWLQTVPSVLVLFRHPLTVGGHLRSPVATAEDTDGRR